MNLLVPARLAKLKPFKTIDATWFMPGSAKDGFAEYQESRLPGASYFDIDQVKTPSAYPHMMPDKPTFEASASQLGIHPEDTLLIYDKGNLFSSPRVYWMFETFGHKNLYVLDNFADYVEKGGELETSTPLSPVKSQYKASRVGRWIEFEEMEEIAEDPNYVIIDARPADRFSGVAPEPRAGLPSGHIAGAVSLPAGQVIENGHYKSAEALRQMLLDRGVDLSKQVVCMCGSGVTACIVKYAIDPFLAKPALIYDGSWTEWAQRSDNIVKS